MEPVFDSFFESVERCQNDCAADVFSTRVSRPRSRAFDRRDFANCLSKIYFRKTPARMGDGGPERAVESAEIGRLRIIYGGFACDCDRHFRASDCP